MNQSGPGCNGLLIKGKLSRPTDADGNAKCKPEGRPATHPATVCVWVSVWDKHLSLISLL